MACPYCYARRMYKWFRWNPELSYIEPGFTIDEIQHIKQPSRIFVGSTMELFGPWVKDEWLKEIIEWTQRFPQHTFIFLTKQPQELARWSPFPKNAWVGVSVCNDKMLDVAADKLEDIEAGVKFISFEPLLARLTFSLDYAFYYSGISWAIIGQLTPVSARTAPRIEWVRTIVEAANWAGTKVFLKNNLRPLLVPEDCTKPNALLDDIFWANDKAKLRQEFPVGGPSR